MSSSIPAEGSTPPPETIPDDDDHADAPLTMAASVLLTNLPKDATQALEGAGELAQTKVKVRLRPVGNAPRLKQDLTAIKSSYKFATVVRYLRRKLQLRESETLFCYVNQVFAPGLDEGMGNLWRCFKSNDELTVNYSITPAYG